MAAAPTLGADLMWRRALLGLWAVATIATPAHGETWSVVVAGLGGEAAYDEAFGEESHAVADFARQMGHRTTLLTGPNATREHLGQQLSELASEADLADQIVLSLVGHGSFDRKTYRFNVSGPDVTGEDLKGWLDNIKASVLVIATGSASGALHDYIADEGRLLVTGTRDGNERHATVFGRYFVDALGAEEADLDKDGEVSAGEAFALAERDVADHFEGLGRVATEHPRRSDGTFTLRVGRVDKERYARDLVGPRLPPASSPVPETPDGLERVEELEEAIAELRRNKLTLTPTEYFAELQRLLLEMAHLQRQKQVQGSLDSGDVL
jgi:hypothetical protein